MASGSGSAAKPTSGLALKPDEKLHDPLVEMPWTPAGHDAMKVTLVVVPDNSIERLVVWNKDGRHDVVKTQRLCIEGEHGAELSMGEKNLVVFRCESEGSSKSSISADEWLIRWKDKKDFPTIYRHWRGAREARDPKWAGGRAFYGTPKVAKKVPSDHCCCQWDDEDLRDDPPTIQSKDYCKGSSDQHGHCVAESKCKVEEDDE